MNTEETIFQIALYTAQNANYQAMGVKPYNEVSDEGKKLRVEYFLNELLKVIED